MDGSRSRTSKIEPRLHESMAFTSRSWALCPKASALLGRRPPQSAHHEDDESTAIHQLSKMSLACTIGCLPCN
ncbi:hypothetical protein E4U56_003780 [Claviceps arundinis]|uniref:Uncharacterized protein n=1 Tax=Claviceps arundinis TaxID=1623583 RepID=A0A9P7SMY7_9HYPO|nr:hypothetical protein E4U56_003780 [Claviceps arundinis]